MKKRLVGAGVLRFGLARGVSGFGRCLSSAMFALLLAIALMVTTVLRVVGILDSPAMARLREKLVEEGDGPCLLPRCSWRVAAAWTCPDEREAIRLRYPSAVYLVYDSQR